MTDVGVNATADTITLLANPEEKHRHRFRQVYGSDGTTETTVGNLRLLHWLSIVECLESAISVDAQDELAVTCEINTSWNRGEHKHSDTDSEFGASTPAITCDKGGGNSAHTVRKISAANIVLPLDTSWQDRGAIEVTPEPPDNPSRNDKSNERSNGTNDHDASVGVDICCTSIEHALGALETALRSELIRHRGSFTLRPEAETTVPEPTVMDSTVEDTMRNIRELLEFARERNGKRYSQKQKRHNSEVGTAQQDGRDPDNRRGEMDDTDNHHYSTNLTLPENSAEARGLEEIGEASKRPPSIIENYPVQTTPTYSTVDGVDDDGDDLTRLACGAGKTGDVDALKVGRQSITPIYTRRVCRVLGAIVSVSDLKITGLALYFFGDCSFYFHRVSYRDTQLFVLQNLHCLHCFRLARKTTMTLLIGFLMEQGLLQSDFTRHIYAISTNRCNTYVVRLPPEGSDVAAIQYCVLKSSYFPVSHASFLVCCLGRISGIRLISGQTTPSVETLSTTPACAVT